MIYKKSKMFRNVFLSFGLLSSLSNSQLDAQEKSWNNTIAQGAVIVGTVTAVGTSVVYSICKLRFDNELLLEMESGYDLFPVYDWYQLPGDYLVKTLCGSVPEYLNVVDIEPCVQFAKSKSGKMSDAELFNFPLFVQKMPHTDQAGLYCVAKSYFNDCKCVTLGDLKKNIDSYIEVIEDCFKELKTLTNLSNKSVAPSNLQEFTTFKTQVLQGMQSPIINTSLGFFGYSALHNGERVKTCIIAIAKYHAYLVLLQELFAACIDDNSTILQGDSGVLHFTLQHNNYNQSVKIN
jgi:hypothetical protein